MVQRSPTDRTDTAWTICASLLPTAKPGGRPRTTDMREVVNALCYVRRGGWPWRLLPTDFPPHQSVSHSLRPWRCAGVWERRHDTLRGDQREADGADHRKRGAGARTAASVYTAASAPSGSMSAGGSWW